MASRFVFCGTDQDSTEVNPMSGLASKTGKLYLLGNEPEPDGFEVFENCCATKARRFKLGLSIDDFNQQLKKLKFGMIESF